MNSDTAFRRQLPILHPFFIFGIQRRRSNLPDGRRVQGNETLSVQHQSIRRGIQLPALRRKRRKQHSVFQVEFASPDTCRRDLRDHRSPAARRQLIAVGIDIRTCQRIVGRRNADRLFVDFRSLSCAVRQLKLEPVIAGSRLYGKFHVEECQSRIRNALLLR